MMTLEEAIKHCEEKSQGDSACNLEHRQLAGWLRELQAIKSLPTNLDEAAREGAIETIPLKDYAHEPEWERVENKRRIYIKGFKLGAKWMAGQGVTVKGLLYGGNLGIPDTIPEQFYSDKEEEVIVQIRKKD